MWGAGDGGAPGLGHLRHRRQVLRLLRHLATLAHLRRLQRDGGVQRSVQEITQCDSHVLIVLVYMYHAFRVTNIMPRPQEIWKFRLVTHAVITAS